MSRNNENHHQKVDGPRRHRVESVQAQAEQSPGIPETHREMVEKWSRLLRLIRSTTSDGERLTYEQVLNQAKHNAEVYEQFLASKAPINALEVRVGQTRVWHTVLSHPDGIKETTFERDLPHNAVLHVWRSADREFGEVPLLFHVMEETPMEGLSRTERYSNGRSMTLHVKPNENGEFSIKLSFAVEGRAISGVEHLTVVKNEAEQVNIRGAHLPMIKPGRAVNRVATPTHGPRTRTAYVSMKALAGGMAALLGVMAFSVVNYPPARHAVEVALVRLIVGSEGTREESAGQGSPITRNPASEPGGMAPPERMEAPVGVAPLAPTPSPTKRREMEVARGLLDAEKIAGYPNDPDDVYREFMLEFKDIPIPYIWSVNAYRISKSRNLRMPDVQESADGKQSATVRVPDPPLERWLHGKPKGDVILGSADIGGEDSLKPPLAMPVERALVVPAGWPSEVRGVAPRSPSIESDSHVRLKSYDAMAHVGGEDSLKPALAAPVDRASVVPAGWSSEVRGVGAHSPAHEPDEDWLAGISRFYVEGVDAPSLDRNSKELVRLRVIGELEGDGRSVFVEEEERYRAQATVRTRFGRQEREVGLISIEFQIEDRIVWSVPERCGLRGQTHVQQALCNASLQLGEHLANGGGGLFVLNEQGRDSTGDSTVVGAQSSSYSGRGCE